VIITLSRGPEVLATPEMLTLDATNWQSGEIVKILATVPEPVTELSFNVSWALESSDATFDGLMGEVVVTSVLTVGSLWHNEEEPLDVDADGTISPSDALTVINWINAFGSGILPTIDLGSNLPPPYYDTNSDGFVAPNDALAVINWINANPQASAEGEATSLLGSLMIQSGGGSPTGLTIDPTSVSNIWIVDSSSDRIYEFTAAASRTSGSASPSTSFALAPGNTNPQGLADPPVPLSSGLTNPLASSSTTSSFDSALLAIVGELDGLLTGGKKRK
jgi:hypothetical protein